MPPGMLPYGPTPKGACMPRIRQAKQDDMMEIRAVCQRHVFCLCDGMPHASSRQVLRCWSAPRTGEDV